MPIISKNNFADLATLFAFVGFSALFASPFVSMAEAKSCPPKDTHVCVFQEGGDKGKELIVLQRPQKYTIKNGAIYGSVMKKNAGAAIDVQPVEGSGQIYEMTSTPGELVFRFAQMDQVDEKTDMKALLRSAKRGTVTVLTLSGQGSYAYDGGPKRLLVCQAKYFQQLNPHTKDAGLTDDDICKMMNGEELTAPNPQVKPAPIPPTKR